MSGPDVNVPADLMVYAFRFALGRRTGAPADVARALVAHGEVLPAWQRDQIDREIRIAVEQNRAGAPCDVDEWMKVRRAFRDLAEREL